MIRVCVDRLPEPPSMFEVSPNEAVLVLSDGTSHKIVVPEWAYELAYYFNGGTDITYIPLHRKPKKVKRWQWLLKDNRGAFCLSTYARTEKEAREMWNGLDTPWCVVRPVPETEIETDE